MHSSSLIGQRDGFLGLSRTFVARLGSLPQVLCALHFRAGEKRPLGFACGCELFLNLSLCRLNLQQRSRVFFASPRQPPQLTLSILKSAVCSAHVRRAPTYCDSDVM